MRYEIRPGDTLWGIAERHYGNGALWFLIYGRNRAVIREAQCCEARRRRGMVGPDWIFPGTVLVLP